MNSFLKDNRKLIIIHYFTDKTNTQENKDEYVKFYNWIKQDF